MRQRCWRWFGLLGLLWLGATRAAPDCARPDQPAFQATAFTIKKVRALAAQPPPQAIPALEKLLAGKLSQDDRSLVLDALAERSLVGQDPAAAERAYRQALETAARNARTKALFQRRLIALYRAQSRYAEVAQGYADGFLACESRSVVADWMDALNRLHREDEARTVFLAQADAPGAPRSEAYWAAALTAFCVAPDSAACAQRWAEALRARPSTVLQLRLQALLDQFQTSDLHAEQRAQAEQDGLIAVGKLTLPPYASLTPLARTAPQYPRDAFQRGIEGWVQVQLEVDAGGNVLGTTVVDSDPKAVFDESAQAALRNWKFKPVLVDGVATHATTLQTVEFQVGG